MFDEEDKDNEDDEDGKDNGGEREDKRVAERRGPKRERTTAHGGKGEGEGAGRDAENIMCDGHTTLSAIGLGSRKTCRESVLAF